MSERHYDWKRFWCPRSGHINLSDRGYLVNPESEWGKSQNLDLIEIEAIVHLPCVVLLGEPGIGKSKTIEAARIKLAPIIKEDGGDLIYLDLHSFGSEDRLIGELFDGSQFRRWLEGDYTLHLFLDSLDECLIRLDNVTSLLAEKFGAHQDHVNRLFLRITCRTAVWQPTFEKNLRNIWGEDQVSVYELAPLRCVDVQHAANCEGIEDVDAFMLEIWDKKIVPLAIKPITLGFLFNIYRSKGQFSEGQTLCDLYLEGCRILCDEDDEGDPRLPGRKGNLELDQRLIIAARIASITVFAQRDAVRIGRDRGQVSDDDVFLRELAQGYEKVNDRQFEVSEAVITEVLDTGLFSSRGSSRMGWAHQTYAEFLAAWYVKKCNLSQILSLIVHPDGRIVPQLQEVAAWLASINSEVFQEIIRIDPNILLQSDIASYTEKDKASLVDSLLLAYEEDKSPYQYKSWEYQNLDHPEISNQLRCYLSRDVNKKDPSRLTAINIARACNVEALQDDLVNLVLDPTQSHWIRDNAITAVCKIGNKEAKRRLKPLIFSEIGDDINDSLKGYTFQANYPESLTIEELLNSITQPKSRSIGGTYAHFLANELAKNILVSDLPAILKWINHKLGRRYGLHYPFQQLSDSILLKSWQNLDEPDVIEAFTEMVRSRLKQHDTIFGDSRATVFPPYDDCDNRVEVVFREAPLQRRKLIEKLVLLSSDSQDDNDKTCIIGIICSDDVLWLINNAVTSNSDLVTDLWIKLLRGILISRGLYWKNYQHVDAILGACETSKAMALEFRDDFTAIVLDSKKTKAIQDEYLRHENLFKSYQQQPLCEPPPKQRVVGLLDKIETGNYELVWQLYREMTLLPHSTHYDNCYDVDITEFPGWKEADETVKQRIIKVAKTYICKGDPENNTWLGKNSIFYPALAGYRSIRSLAAIDPDFISQIPADIWERWIAIILDYPNVREDKDKEMRSEIINQAYQNASGEFIKVFMVLIDKENQQHRQLSIHQQAMDCWDDKLEKAFLEKLNDDRLTASSLGSLLQILLENKVDRARLFAESLICSGPAKSGEIRDKSVVAAQKMLLYSGNPSWSVIWERTKQEPNFGREVFEAVSYDASYSGHIDSKLAPSDIADLYIFFVQQYPDIILPQQDQSEDEGLSGIEAWITRPEDSISTWRDFIPQRLQERGTEEACDSLKKIISIFPEKRESLTQKLLECQALERRKAWKPPKPEDILRIVNQHYLCSSQGENSVTNNFTFDQRGANIGVNVANEGSNIQFQQSNSSNQSKDLAEAAAEIQDLLQQLESTNPNATESEKTIYVSDKANPGVKKRAISALSQGSETAFDEFVLESKYLKVGKAVLKGWLNPNGSSAIR